MDQFYSNNDARQIPKLGEQSEWLNLSLSEPAKHCVEDEGNVDTENSAVVLTCILKYPRPGLPLVNLEISFKTRLSPRSQLHCFLEFCLIWKYLSSDGEGDDSVDFLQDEI